MKNKKMYLIFILVILVVAAAAFVGGRLLNGSATVAGPGGLLSLGSGPDGGGMAVSIMMSPAPELPTTQPVITGIFSKRQDNSIFIQSFAMMEGVSAAGGVVVSSGGAGEAGGPVTAVGPGASAGPITEVVITKDTILYRDATEISAAPPSGNTTVQQKVEPGNLDDLKSQTMVMVWGRKSGDRIIADVISYSNPIMIQR